MIKNNVNSFLINRITVTLFLKYVNRYSKLILLSEKASTASQCSLVCCLLASDLTASLSPLCDPVPDWHKEELELADWM